ncbi:MAG: hypothetical protein LBQ31_00925 [Bacteroidales bacterium]|nr:hypothetical protein [Bacteroidales bacterium]
MWNWAFPRPLAELRGRGRAFRCNLFANAPQSATICNANYHLQNKPLAKRISAAIPNASPPQCPTRADYAERERLINVVNC